MKYNGRWKVKKGGKHQSFKWCVYKEPSTTPANHLKTWKEAMMVCISLAHKRTVSYNENFG